MLELVIYRAGSLIWTALMVIDYCRGAPWRADLAVALIFVVLSEIQRSRMAQEE